MIDLRREDAAIGIAGSIFLLVTAGIVIVGLTYYGGDMLQRAQTESKVGQHARQQSTFGNAVAKFVEAKGDGLSDGRHVYTGSDLKSLGFLNNSFNETTPWGEQFVVYLIKNGNDISGVISEYGSVDKKAVKTVVDNVNDETLRALKLRVAQKRVKLNPTSDDVPGVGKDGSADGVKGMYEDVDISSYVTDGTPRYVSLMNVDGLGAIPSIKDRKFKLTDKHTYHPRGSYSYSPPSDIDYVEVVVVGGGGGGQNDDGGDGSCGAGSGYVEKTSFPATVLDSSVDIQVGRGGRGEQESGVGGGERGRPSRFGQQGKDYFVSADGGFRGPSNAQFSPGGNVGYPCGLSGMGYPYSGRCRPGDFKACPGYGGGGNSECSHYGQEKGADGRDGAVIVKEYVYE